MELGTYLDGLHDGNALEVVHQLAGVLSGWAHVGQLPAFAWAEGDDSVRRQPCCNFGLSLE